MKKEKTKNSISVSNFLASISKEFDKDYWAEKTSKKRGISKEDILKEWDDKAKLSVSIGDFFADIIEGRIKDKNLSVLHFQKIADKRMLDLNVKELYEVATQVIATMLKDRKRGFAFEQNVKGKLRQGDVHGIADCINQSENDNTAYVYEFKRSKISFDNTYPDGSLLHDYSELPDCKIVKYILQLLIYMTFVKNGIVYGKLLGSYFDEKNDKFFCVEIVKKETSKNTCYKLIKCIFPFMNKIESAKVELLIKKTINTFKVISVK